MNEKKVALVNYITKQNISARPKNNEKQMIIDREKALVMSSKKYTRSVGFRGHWECFCLTKIHL